VEQEPSDELGGGERHHFRSVAVASLPPPERHLARLHRHQAVMTERYPMRIAAQVGDDMLRRRKGGLRVDDPGLLPQRREKPLKGPGVPEGCRRPGTLQAVRSRPCRLRLIS